MSSVILTGRWTGHYLQRGKEYPITADILEGRDRLSGFMYDGQPDRDFSVSEALAEAGPGTETPEQMEAKLREMVPDAPAGPIRYVSHLPPNSVLQGRRTGQSVYFLKSYQGTSFDGYQVGDRLLGIQRANHQVHYEGQVSPDGLSLEGRWWIDPDPVQGSPGAEGLFHLRRTEAGQRHSVKATPRAGETKRPWWRFWA
jgi:hypothetical protein